MPIDHDHLVWKALVALDEIVHRSSHAPIAGDFSLRFTLAYLHATGKGDRHHHDDFWRAIGRSIGDEFQIGASNYMRSRDARTAMYGIARGHGIELTFDLQQRMAAEHRWVDRHPTPIDIARKKGPT
jgi:hypothetical protein